MTECSSNTATGRSPPTLSPAPTPLAMVPKKERRIDLVKLSHVRDEMSRVYREMRRGDVETQDGTRLVYVLTQIAKVIEVSELEQRIEALEDKA